ncbi:SDR family NAD(P)-dependent oxidoreductase [Actinomadura graeca]|uniref:SDR family NAD(P)-dependent oxidoreductase n=1 Tax=Actinomadura graeca TaxID=2750812 RepID=A0ABX8R315_9ACTN|nr:SDR family NAD(P)-dependent oxidoreductase [Actinomadura graeca]QXJ23393.1 SDR family NAD(P)-dependent oxidoreductase [Actinomadura graeca]
MASPPPGRTALVTGCSSGIGRATALRLHRRGLRVYATAREPGTLEDLAGLGIRTLALDVTDIDAARAAVETVTADHGAVDVLVNNAGYGLSGTIEETGLERVRHQFETNVFGLVGLTQLVLPGMRARGSGRVVNLSSIFGRYAAPGGGHYQASKHAVEALSDALRLEVAGFGIRVVVVEPGPVRTAWGRTFLDGLPSGRHDSAYRRFHERTAEYYEAIYNGGRRSLAGMFAIEADRVASVIEKAVRARRPRARYPVGLLAASTIALRRVTPDTVFDNVYLRRQFPVP